MRNMTKALSVAAVVAMTAASFSTTAFAEDTFKIGGIGPITGGAAVYGQAVMNASQMAADEINEAGGINGYQIEDTIYTDTIAVNKENMYDEECQRRLFAFEKSNKN